MKNRAKFISLLVAVCMMITLLPAVALAAANTVMIGNSELSASNPYYHNGENGAQGTANNVEDGYNAHFNASDGTLTLNGLNIVNVYTNDDAKGISWAYANNTNDGVDLTIVIKDGTTNIVTNSRGAAILGKTGLGPSGPSLTIKGETNGTGKLIATGSSHGIWVWKNITITDNANVIATGIQKNGISTNGSNSTITIANDASVFADGGEYGIGYDNNPVTAININSSKVTSKGGTGSFEEAPTVGTGITKTDNGNTSTFGNDAPAHGDMYVFFDPNVNASNFEKAKAPAMAAQSVAGGSQLTLANYSAEGFGNWNTKADKSGTECANQATFTPERNMILYAQKGVPVNPTPTPSPSPDNTTPTPTPDVPTVDASNGIDLWYNGGNSFGSSKGDVPTSVEIDGVPVAFNGTGSSFTVGCVSPNAKWVTVKWHGTTVTTNFTPDANATCSEINIPKTGDASVMAFSLMAVVAAAGALRRK